ncbi:MAG: glycosyltransferase family 39 protein [Clostridia bacterium]
MRKLFAIVAAAACLIVPAAALAETTEASGSNENLIYNADFSVYTNSAELPSGWDLESYSLEDAGVFVDVDEDKGTYVSIENFNANDTRVCQTVKARPNTCYMLTGWVKPIDVFGGTGATLSIDNYNMDGTYCYSDNLHDTSDWQRLTMYVRTGPEQTELRVALRIGGYGTTASGEAYFAQIALRECEEAGTMKVIDLMTENGTITDVSVEETTVKLESPNSYFALILIAVLLCAALFTWLYLRVLRYEGNGLKLANENGKGSPTLLAVLLVGAFVCRLALSLIFYGHPTDIGCFMAWGEAGLNVGLPNFYTSGMFADYPPGYMYICTALSGMCRLLGISYGSTGMAFLFKLPATLADLGSAYLVYRIARKSNGSEAFSLILAGLLAFNPVLMFVSGAWGQIDTVLTLLLVLTCYLLQKDKRIFAGAIYGLAILMKPQALMLGPLLAVAFIADIFGENWKKKLLHTVLAVLAALAVLVVLSLPFTGNQPWYWLIKKYGETATSYQYASIEAFNFPALIGGNWRKIENVSLLGIPYATVGVCCIMLAVGFSVFLYLRGYRKNQGVVYLCGAVMILLIFTFGHYMHERYMIPVIMLLLMAYLYLKDRRLLIAFGGVSISALLNVLCAMYVVGNQAARGPLYLGITAVGSALEIFSCGYLVYIAIRIVLNGQILPTLSTPEKTQEQIAAAQAEKVEPLLPLKPTDNKLCMTKRDCWYVLGITLLYGVIALMNLGSLKSPESYWEATKPGEQVTVRFAQAEHVTGYWINGNIRTGGTLLVQADEYESTFEQTYDDMFRWKPVSVDFVSDSVTLTLYSGTLKLNEIAFFGDNGKLLPVTVTSTGASDAALFDEQDTVPEIPSYENGMYFDELYHGRTAYEHLHNLKPFENSHPPLGKIFIMLGVAVFGMNPFGWRVVGALFGIAMLPVFYAFGKRVFKNSNYALLATTLFAFDFMHFTQTRIATIDVYAVFFILLMYYYMLEYVTMNFFVDGLKKTLKPLFLAGLFFGIGAACKWTCIYAGGGLAVLLFGSLVARYFEYTRVRQSGTAAQKKQVAPYWKYVEQTLLICCVFYIVIPFTIYFLSYVPYFIYEAGQMPDYGIADAGNTWWKYQTFMYNYHSNLQATHPYQSVWYQWPFTTKPMWYYFNSYSGGKFVSTMSASGNPAVWWICSVGTVILLVQRLAKRIKPDRALQIICVGVLANYLPWVLVTRCTFIYHFFATVPFLILAAVYALQRVEERDKGCVFVKWVWIGLTLLFFVLLYPGLSGQPVSPGWAAFLHNLPGGTLMYGA